MVAWFYKFLLGVLLLAAPCFSLGMREEISIPQLSTVYTYLTEYFQHSRKVEC